MSEMANTKERSGEFARIAIAALEEKKATLYHRKRIQPPPDAGYVR